MENSLKAGIQCQCMLSACRTLLAFSYVYTYYWLLYSLLTQLVDFQLLVYGVYVYLI